MKPLKVISDLLPIPSYSVIIICFFFPFFLVKCGSTTLVSVKGTDLITGISKEKMNKQMKETLKKDSPFGSFGNDNSTDESGYTPMDKSDNSKGNIPPNPFIIICGFRDYCACYSKYKEKIYLPSCNFRNSLNMFIHFLLDFSVSNEWTRRL
ncbi:hypothetical protein [Elizabethkingia anophelis]|uniref:hypothetical protein n=1 Tax=Elizabethkingia anophelis TaxID=1117645 RepID=UPI0024E1297F|nr:hypothetical protein [Elizabethkingia anophelis]